MITTASDHAGLLDLFGGLAGRIVLGAVDCEGCVEVVLSGSGMNLLTIDTAGRNVGRVRLGGVADGPAYYERCRRA